MAHASCADAALADDRHWDEVAARGDDDVEASAPPDRETGTSRGCLSTIAILLVVGGAMAVGLLS